jgi:hypothetical protein
MVFTIEFLFVLRALISSIPRTANSLGSFYPRIFLEALSSQKSFQKMFRYLQQPLLKTGQFEKAVVIHHAIGVPATRHNFDGGNSIQICWEAC